jgi:hypothetical protein
MANKRGTHDEDSWRNARKICRLNDRQEQTFDDEIPS